MSDIPDAHCPLKGQVLTLMQPDLETASTWQLLVPVEAQGTNHLDFKW